MTVREGVTDAQTVDALRQGLPHLTDPVSLQDRRAGKQPEGTGTSEKGKQPAAQSFSGVRITCEPCQGYGTVRHRDNPPQNESFTERDV